jgi:nucleoside-diphosphate-sugar epimerase
MDSEREGGSSGDATSVVTGAFGFSGQQIAKRLLIRGEKVRTLTNHAQPGSPLFGRVQVAPLDFGNTAQLTESMRGAALAALHIPTLPSASCPIPPGWK